MLQTQQEVRAWLDAMKITKYTIHDDLTVDVEGHVMLGQKNLTELPVQFDLIHGAFAIAFNNLQNLKGCPKKVFGNFWCNNNKLKNLQYGPEEVMGIYDCSCNEINTLEYLPLIMKEGIVCENNNLTSFKGLEKFQSLYSIWAKNNHIASLQYTPAKLAYALHIENNHIENFDYLPEGIGSLKCSGNPIATVKGINYKLGDFDFSNTDISLEEVMLMEFKKQATITFTPSDLTQNFVLEEGENSVTINEVMLKRIELEHRLMQKMKEDQAVSEQSSSSRKLKI